MRAGARWTWHAHAQKGGLEADRHHRGAARRRHQPARPDHRHGRSASELLRRRLVGARPLGGADRPRRAWASTSNQRVQRSTSLSVMSTKPASALPQTRERCQHGRQNARGGAYIAAQEQPMDHQRWELPGQSELPPRDLPLLGRSPDGPRRQYRFPLRASPVTTHSVLRGQERDGAYIAPQEQPMDRELEPSRRGRSHRGERQDNRRGACRR